LDSPSLEIGVNDGSSATIAHFGKPKFSYGGDMPEESTCESAGLHIEPNYDVYENLVGMDAHELPFPDESFNTIITNDMLSYGLDRVKILTEMTRVLAPGGTLFLSESTGSLNNYPSLLARLKKDIPSLDLLDNPVSFYKTTLEGLGMANVQSRTYFDHRISAIVFGSLYQGEVANEFVGVRRGLHEDRLRAIAALLSDDLNSPTDSGDGWQVFARCTKPGKLNQSIAVPELICLSCRNALKVTPDDCTCPKCGAAYQNRLGIPLVLSDFGKSYSPKTGELFKINGKLAVNMVEKIMSNLGKPDAVSIYGFDQSTKYLIKSLLHRGISVARIYVGDPGLPGYTVSGVPIVSSNAVSGEELPVVMSLGSQFSDQDSLRALGYGHRSYIAQTPSGLRRLRELVGLT